MVVCEFCKERRAQTFLVGKYYCESCTSRPEVIASIKETKNDGFILIEGGELRGYRYKMDGENMEVMKSNGQTYSVKSKSCSCPGYLFRHFCKHHLFYKKHAKENIVEKVERMF